MIVVTITFTGYKLLHMIKAHRKPTLYFFVLRYTKQIKSKPVSNCSQIFECYYVCISAHPPPIPDGPFNPTNYSGTQINVWGGATPPFIQGGTPGVVNLGQPGICNPYTTQYGYLTENMLQVRYILNSA